MDYSEELNVIERYNLVPGEEEVLPLYDDLTGHGTGVVSIIASRGIKNDVEGVNSNVEIYSIKVFDGKNTAPLSRIIEAIYKAVEYDVDIINMSFGAIENSELLHKAIIEAYENDIMIVAAAGNKGVDGKGLEYPAAYDEVLSVGSVDSLAKVSEYSSDKGNTDIFAPGEMVKTMSGFGAETVMSGTSIAVPHVVGAASILWQKDKSKSVDFIKGLLQESANRTSDGYPILDLEYALEIYDEYDNDMPDASDTIPNNDGDIEVCEETIRFESSWTRVDHASLVKTTFKDINGNAIESKYITLLKAGIRLPDAFWTDTNMWHALSSNTNYIVAAHWTSRVIKTDNCNAQNVGIINGMTNTQWTNMKNDITNLNWANVATEYGLSNNSFTYKEKRFVLWGVVMHIVTDAYAHRAYRKVNGTWTHIDSPDTDNTAVVPLRFQAAGQVVKNIINQCIDASAPYSSNYFTGQQMALSDSYYNGTFKLKELMFFAQENINYEPQYSSYMLQLGKGTQPADTSQMGALMSLGVYLD